MIPAVTDWEARCRASFSRQTMMRTLGIEITELDPGHAVLAMSYSTQFTQQHGFLHAAATTAIADSACGYAAYTLAPAGHTVLTVEFKINLLAPARGERFTADAQVVRAGRSLSVCTATVTAHDGEDARAAAQMQATIMLFEGADE